MKNKISKTEQKKNTTIQAIKNVQDELGSLFNTSVIAFTSIDDGNSVIDFAKQFADVYASNNVKCLVMDANLYKPLLGLKETDKIIKSTGCVDMISYSQRKYPYEFFKDQKFISEIEKYKKEYSHILLVLPNVFEHKEMSILKDVIDCSLLICRKDEDNREVVYNAVSYLKDNDLKLAKVVVLSYYYVK